MLAERWTLSDGQTVGAVAPAGSTVQVSSSPQGTISEVLTTSPIVTAATVAAARRGEQEQSSMSVYQRSRFLGASPRIARRIAARADRDLAHAAYSKGQTIFIPCVSKSLDSNNVFEQNCDKVIYLQTLGGMYDVGDQQEGIGSDNQGGYDVTDLKAWNYWQGSTDLKAWNYWQGSTAHVVNERPTDVHSTGSCVNANFGLSAVGISWGASEDYCNGTLSPGEEFNGSRLVGWGEQYSGSGGWIEGVTPTDEALTPPGDSIVMGISMSYT
jgi:hypothetical protein